MNRSFLTNRSAESQYELAAESIAVKIRWVGLVAGAVLVHFFSRVEQHLPLNAILLLGLFFTALDTFFFLRGRVFLKDYPLLISAMEALFIGLLCHYESGLNSPFRFYYLLSLVCCAIRYSAKTTYISCFLDCLSYGFLFLTNTTESNDLQQLAHILILFVWVSWAASTMAGLARRTGEQLQLRNAELRENQLLLETRIAERTLELEVSQAQVLHQEKMAAFGLLAAGIAHEVGNPLTSISSLVQMLERRDLDHYTREKLGHVNGQLVRIQSILRELVTFSRPASDERSYFQVREVVEEALGIAKYYKGGKNRTITSDLPDALPLMSGVRDKIVQVVFNLVLNAIDATGKGGKITIRAEMVKNQIVLSVHDDGHGIPVSLQSRLFRAYFTTKRHGTGLGLFVIRNIVQEHCGDIQFESRANEGTTFRILLPVPIQLPLTEAPIDRLTEGT